MIHECRFITGPLHFYQQLFIFISEDLEGKVNGVADDLEKQKINDAQGEGTRFILL